MDDVLVSPLYEYVFINICLHMRMITRDKKKENQSSVYGLSYIGSSEMRCISILFDCL